MEYKYNDGGRAHAGFKGSAGDCVARAVTIASYNDYALVYNALAEGNATQRAGKKTPPGKRTAGAGINTNRVWFKRYMVSLGFVWVPTMQIGTGCRVHLVADELPAGRLVVSLSKHYTAVIDGTVHDDHDPRRGGKRCVYGYWRFDD